MKNKSIGGLFLGDRNDKKCCKKIKKATGGNLYQIKAADPYTKADLDYTKENCRANEEQKDGKVRPEIKGKVKNIRKYDVIFVGFPIWWGKEPMIIRTFLESYNLRNKKIVPFCTSGVIIFTLLYYIFYMHFPIQP